jgi:hypothetical protein
VSEGKRVDTEVEMALATCGAELTSTSAPTLTVTPKDSAKI